MLQINSLKGSAEKNNAKGATFEEPLELLLSCHEKIMHYSSALCTVIEAIKTQGWTEQHSTSIEQIRRYFNIASPEHHLDEEQHLFPAIIALDSDFKQPQSMTMVTLINRLIKEHVESDGLWEELDQLLGERSNDMVQLEARAQQFKKDMHQHAKIENEEVFPYAKAHISVAEFKKMGQAIAQRRGVNTQP